MILKAILVWAVQIIYIKVFIDLYFISDFENEFKSPNKKKESQKMEISNLLSGNLNRKSFKKNENFLENICQKEKISKFHFISNKSFNENQKAKSRSKIFLNSGKFYF